MSIEAPRPEEPKKVFSVDPHSVEYHMVLTSRLFHVAGLAKIADTMLYRHMGGQGGMVEMMLEDIHGKNKRKAQVNLTPEYVARLKGIAFRTYLSLYDIKPEGPNIAQQVMDNLNEVDRTPTKLEDHIDDQPKPTNQLEPGGPVD